MLRGSTGRHSKPKDLPRWRAVSEREWQEDDEDDSTLRPHILLVTLTGAKAPENGLLHGEIGPTVEAIQQRLAQEEFQHTSFFPVCTKQLLPCHSFPFPC